MVAPVATTTEGRTVRGDCAVDRVSRGLYGGAGGVRNQKGVFVEVEASRATHHAFLVLLADFARVLEQTLEGIDQLDRRGSREQALALIIHRREVVVQRLATVKNGVPT